MSDVTLSAAVRNSLLSLQNTTDLIDRTQNRLSTGLKVASAIDDPVAFFQAKTLSAKLTLADINEEGANLLALQTRQQLGISSLDFVGQAEQGILALFR